MRRTAALLASLATALTTVITPTATAEPDEDLGGRGFAATIRYTEFGIPHIKAANYGGLGYGYAYATAKDNICVLADTYLTVNAQRSRYLGPDAPANDAYGDARNSLASDLFHRQVIDSGIVERSLGAARPEVRELVRGYVAGYNRFLRENRITDPTCRGAAWVRPITEMDVYRQFYASATVSGTGALIDSITSTQPPTAPTATTAAPIPPDAADRVRKALGTKENELGSNAIAVGSAGTTNRRGLLLGNPHFPWHGGNRFWQSQLTIPGRLDVSGASLLGIPLILIGFNRDVAWSHTVSTTATFGFYQVKLTSPTTYLVDGKPEPMTSRVVRVEVRNPDGSIGTVERTLYSTRYGPVLSPAFGLPLVWTKDSAYTIRDANEGNLRGMNTWFEMDHARGTSQIVDALKRTQGVPWVNTTAADQSGRALYADVQVVPHITDELAARCNTPLGSVIFPDTGIAVLDGSRADCAWGNDPDSRVPGLFGPNRMPVLTRSDYASNFNDSPWLANARQPITGYPRVFGDIGTERSPRTRMGITAIEEQLARGRFARQTMQDLLFSDRSYAGERAAADTAAMCASLLDTGRACAALSNWDRKMTLRSQGGLFFERYWRRIAFIPNLWKVPFNPADPVGTPNTLNTANPEVRKALSDTIAEFRAAGIEPDAPLGQNHYVVRNGKVIGIHGGQSLQGVLNVITPVWDPARGNVEVVHGSSHIQAVSFTGGHCPDAATLLTYSQSSDPTSRHHADQTELFSAGRWVRSRFCEHDILTSPDLRVLRLREH